MPKGLPTFEQVFDLNQEESLEPKTRQLTPPRDLSKVRIEALDQVFSNEVAEVQLNPTSVTEQKSANWVKKYIPGQSDPLLQWINGTERVVSFDVYVTKDKVENETITAGNTETVEIVTNDFSSLTAGLELSSGDIPSTEGNILSSLTEGFGFTEEQERSGRYWALSIQSHLDYYRSLLVPRTSSRRNQLKTPPLIRLRMGSILGTPNQTERTRWILASYNKNITKFSPQLEPIEATISLTFIEYKAESRSVNAEQAQNNFRTKRQTAETLQSIKESAIEDTTSIFSSTTQNLA